MSLVVRLFHLNSPVSHCIARALGWKSRPLIVTMLAEMIDVKMPTRYGGGTAVVTQSGSEAKQTPGVRPAP